MGEIKIMDWVVFDKIKFGFGIENADVNDKKNNWGWQCGLL